jgi:hypothetical protein
MKTFDTSPGRPDGTDETFDRFCRLRDEAGLRAALAYLGSVTGYRHAAVIRQSADGPDAVAYVDRDQPDAHQPAQWPKAVRSACLVRGGDGRVREAGELDEVQDDSTPHSPAGACRCVPVIDADGRLHASLCVFDDSVFDDKAETNSDDIDLPLLLRIAASLAREGAELTPGGSWQSTAGEEDPGSAADVFSSRSRRPIRGSSMSALQSNTAPSSLYEG